MRHTFFLLALLLPLLLPAQKTILVVFAHPDDETAIGPVLVKYAKTNTIHLVVASNGRYGVREHAGIPEGDSLAAVRREELDCSCKALGIQPPVLLGAHDGMGTRTGIREFFRQSGALKEKLKEQIEKLNPAFIITFGPDGDTGHSDHRMISNLTTQVILEQGWMKRYPLYYLAWTKLQPAAVAGNLQTLDPQYVNLTVQFSDEEEARSWEALRCHKSQLTDAEVEEIIQVDQKDGVNVLHFRRFAVATAKQKDF